MRAVWLTNATGSTLDGGSFSIIEGEAFAGEGVMDPLKAGERRLLSYAMDLALTIDAKAEPVPTRLTSVRISRGVVMQQTEERLRSTYSARNEDAEARTLVIEHPVRAGWTLGGTVKPVESTPAWHRFRVTIEPRTTVTFVVEETRANETQFSVSSVTDDQVALLVREKTLTAAQEAALREVIARKAAIAALASRSASGRAEINQIGTDQTRVRENMRSLKGSSEEKQLLQRYVKQLNDQETRLDALRKELDDLNARQQQGAGGAEPVHRGDWVGMSEQGRGQRAQGKGRLKVRGQRVEAPFLSTLCPGSTGPEFARFFPLPSALCPLP